MKQLSRKKQKREVEEEGEEEKEIEEKPEEVEVEVEEEEEEEEMIDEKQVEEQFKSNIFHLQITELLESLTPNYSKLSKLANSHLESIAHSLHVNEEAEEEEEESSSDKWKPPTSMEVIGSIASGTAAKIGGKCSVDISANIPASWFLGFDLSDSNSYSQRRDEWIKILQSKLPKSFDSQLLAIHNGRKISVVKIPLGESTAIKADLFIIPTMAELEDSPNELLSRDSFAPKISSYLIECTKECKSMKDTSVLLRAWMNHRWSNNEETDIVTPFHATLILANLVKNESGNKFLSSYQLFRLLLTHISTVNDVQELISEMSIEETSFGSSIKRSSLIDFAHEARISLAQLDLNTTTDGGFDALFLKNITAAMKYDCVLQVRISQEQFDSEAILSVLDRGIGSRCLLIRQIPLEQQKQKQKQNIITIGLILNPGTCLKIVERGPSAADVEAVAEFQELWGDKAEVRRFKDGAIIEATVWDHIPPNQRHQVVEEMCTHLINLHFGNKSLLRFSCSQLDNMIPEDVDSSSIKLITIFETLSKRMKTLDIPLKIKAIQSTSSSLRYSDVCFPNPNALGSVVPGDAYISPIRGVIRTETSRSWPDDLEALKQVKSALYVKISQSLTTKHKISSFPYDDHIEIFFKGYAFHFIIHCQREIAMLKKSSPVVFERTRLECIERPLHSAAIHALALKYQAFPKTVRLAKRWIHSHMFSHHISEEAIELLVAHCFTNPAPELAPQTHISGFYRFLKFISSINPSDLPILIIVDFNNDFTVAQNAGILKSFESRKANKEGKLSPSLFISTSYNPKTSVFTNSSPSPVVMRRMISFASRSAELLESLIQGSAQTKWSTLFTTPLSDYSFLIHLSANKLPRLWQSLPWQTNPTALKMRIEKEETISKRARGAIRNTKLITEPPLIGFDPASILFEELVRNFGDRALFFHNVLGGDIIAGVWRPETINQRQWKGSDDTSCIKPISLPSNNSQNNVVQFNVIQAFHDMELLGFGLIDSIEEIKH